MYLTELHSKPALLQYWTMRVTLLVSWDNVTSFFCRDYTNATEYKSDERHVATKALYFEIVKKIQENLLNFTFCFQGWTDERLAWPSHVYGQVDAIFLSANDIWTPDIDVHNRWLCRIFFFFDAVNVIKWHLS